MNRSYECLHQCYFSVQLSIVKSRFIYIYSCLFPIIIDQKEFTTIDDQPLRRLEWIYVSVTDDQQPLKGLK